MAHFTAVYLWPTEHSVLRCTARSIHRFTSQYSPNIKLNSDFCGTSVLFWILWKQEQESAELIRPMGGLAGDHVIPGTWRESCFPDSLSTSTPRSAMRKARCFFRWASKMTSVKDPDAFCEALKKERRMVHWGTFASRWLICPPWNMQAN